MVDTVRYINPEHSLVKVEPEGWTVPQPSRTWHQEKITQWLEGRTDEWDKQKADYDSYQSIINYENDLFDYETALNQCQNDYDACIADSETDNRHCVNSHGLCVGFVNIPIKPEGYYTQEEVDASIAAWNEWSEIPADEFGNRPPQPIILKRPEDLPIVHAPSPLIPNEIADYIKPVSETINEKAAYLKENFTAEAYADVASNGQVWAGGAESASIINGQADKTTFRGRPTGIIHSKNHEAHELNVNQIKEISADIADAYELSYNKYRQKLLELEGCGEDTACINAITW